jgi:hypothetical protein
MFYGRVVTPVDDYKSDDILYKFGLQFCFLILATLLLYVGARAQYSSDQWTADNGLP